MRRSRQLLSWVSVWKVLGRKGTGGAAQRPQVIPPEARVSHGGWALSCLQGQGLHTCGDEGHSSQVSPLHEGWGHQAVLPGEWPTPVIFRTF